jgi:hypothetical protein
MTGVSLVKDTGPNVIAQSMQLIAGLHEYNRRRRAHVGFA